jgi:hypothetical protein
MLPVEPVILVLLSLGQDHTGVELVGQGHSAVKYVLFEFGQEIGLLVMHLSILHPAEQDPSQPAIGPA